MRLRKIFTAAMVLLLSAAAIGGTGECMGTHGDRLVLTGTVRVIGNEPFTSRVLWVQPPDEGGRRVNYLVTGPLASEIRSRYQLKTLTVEGRRCGESGPERLPCIEPGKILKIEE
jgi:hypothetical protein